MEEQVDWEWQTVQIWVVLKLANWHSWSTSIWSWWIFQRYKQSNSRIMHSSISRPFCLRVNEWMKWWVRFAFTSVHSTWTIHTSRRQQWQTKDDNRSALQFQEYDDDAKWDRMKRWIDRSSFIDVFQRRLLQLSEYWNSHSWEYWLGDWLM